MRITIHVPIYRKPNVREIFAAGVHRLIKAFPNDSISVLAIISPEDDTHPIDWAVENEFQVTLTANKPLSNKFNHGLLGINNIFNPDVVLFLGSDNMISNSYIQQMKTAIEDGKEWGGCYDCYFADLKSKRIVHWNGYEGKRNAEPIGTGRFMTRKMLRHFKYQIWPNGLPSSCDYYSFEKINSAKFRRHIIRLKGTDHFMVDLKGDNNMGKLPRIDAKIVKPENWSILEQHLSTEEIELINKYATHSAINPST